MTLAGDLTSLEPGAAARRCRFRMPVSRRRGARRDGTRLIFFGRIFTFGDFEAFPVAVSRHACRVLATVGVLALAGCATTPPGGGAPPPASPEAVKAAVTARANARWDAIVKNDIDRAYTFLSPASREATSLEKYKATARRREFREGKVESVTCEADACRVRVLVTYDHPRMKGITTPIVESWIMVDGQAWYVLLGG